MLNKVMIIGNVGNDPEIKSMPNGNRLASFNVATSEFWKDKNGEKQTKTEWHKVVVFNDNLVKVIESYLKKGSKIYLEGSIRTRKYTDTAGLEKYITEIVVQGYSDTLKILDSKSEGQAVAQASPTKISSQGVQDGSAMNEDEIPF